MSKEFKLVPVELLERLFSDEPDGYVTRMNARQELLALLAKPADQQGEPVACTSCDGSGEYIDALGDWRGYCSCPPGVELKEKHAQPATAKVDERAEFEAWWESEMNTQVFDLHRCNFPMQKPEFEQPYACGDTERGWLSWQARAKLNTQQ